MARTITVKGVGSASTKPDYVVLNMTLDSRDMKYEKAMDLASEQIERLTEELSLIGFAKEDLKTTDFHVDTDYKNVRTGDGGSERVFNGYVVRHQLKLGFDFDPELLSDSLAAVSGCMADPSLRILFTVKDPAGVNEALLRSAAENAIEKAGIICDATGVTLGDLLRIHYDWGKPNVYSETNYNTTEDCMSLKARSIEFEPDDIKSSDTVTFEWEIL